MYRLNLILPNSQSNFCLHRCTAVSPHPFACLERASANRNQDAASNCRRPSFRTKF